MGPAGTGYFAYDRAGGAGARWRFFLPNPNKKKNKAYTKLRGWLEANVLTEEDIRTARVVFGPAARYIAWTRTGKWIANDLPAGFAAVWETRLASVDKDKTKGMMMPKVVAFGKGQSWAIVWADGSNSLHLEKGYAALREYLSRYAAERIVVRVIYLPISTIEETLTDL